MLGKAGWGGGGGEVRGGRRERAGAGLFLDLSNKGLTTDGLIR